MAFDALPLLVSYLNDEDQVVVSEAAFIFDQMSRKEKPREAIIFMKEAVPAIVDCLGRTSDMETAKHLFGALYGITSNKEGVAAICQSMKGPLLLLKSLEGFIDNIVAYSITTIHNILMKCNDSFKAEMRKAGAVHYLIPMLSKQNQRNLKLVTIAVDCLLNLVYGSQEAKILMLDLGGTQQLIGLLFNHNQQYPKLIHNIVRILKVSFFT